MKQILLSLLLAVTALTFGLARPAAALTPAGEAAPDFTLKSLDGKESYTLSELRGQVVYLDFWASWCGPCRRSFPEVQALQVQYKDRPFRVLAVSLDRNAADGIKFMDAQKPGFPSAFDEGGKVATRYGVQSIPSSFVIGPDGKIAHSAVGFDPRGLPQLKTKIEGLLATAEAGAKGKQPASRVEAEKGR